MSRAAISTLRLSVILMFFASMAGCSSGGSIIGDYDPGNDFGAYQTWDFIEGAGPDYEGYESLFSQYMMEAIEIEMTKRGYTKSANPDIFLNFNAYVQDKTKVTQTPSTGMGMGYPYGGGGYYGYRGASYGAWGGYTALKRVFHNTRKAPSISTLSMPISSNSYGKRSVSAKSQTSFVRT